MAEIVGQFRTAIVVALAVRCYIPCLSHSEGIVAVPAAPALDDDAVDHVVVVVVVAAAVVVVDDVAGIADVKEKVGKLGRNPPDTVTLHSAVIRLGVTVYRRTVILCIHNPRIPRGANFSHVRLPRGLLESKGWTGAVV